MALAIQLVIVEKIIGKETLRLIKECKDNRFHHKVLRISSNVSSF